MEALTVATTYGAALFEAARDTGKTDAIAEELAALDQIFRDEPAYFHLVCSPSIDARSKRDVLRDALEGKVSEELLHFLYILIKKRRIGQFHRIVKAYHKQLNDNLGVSTGTLYSASLLPADKLKSLEEQTGKLLQRAVRLENLVDAEIIGGVKIYIDGKLIDASIRKRLDDLKEQLM
ncbi:MAG: ATP synthase F1 subunit delta [Clostridiales Family XIII bacterium]|jgi:ATP synthase F1 delta subunit|nr:ATP synthase F1 subunit delta [Clostridiales Family XIII bacterium]